MINTGGFNLSALPQYNALDPRLFVADPNAALQGFQQGFRGMQEMKRMPSETRRQRAENELETKRAETAAPNVEATEAARMAQVYADQADAERRQYYADQLWRDHAAREALAGAEARAAMGSVDQRAAAELSILQQRAAEARAAGELLQPRTQRELFDIGTREQWEAQRLAGIEAARAQADREDARIRAAERNARAQGRARAQIQTVNGPAVVWGEFDENNRFVPALTESGGFVFAEPRTSGSSIDPMQAFGSRRIGGTSTITGSAGSVPAPVPNVPEEFELGSERVRILPSGRTQGEVMDWVNLLANE